MSAPALTSLRVLAVDDDIFLLELVREMLLGIGITNVMAASDGHEALTLLDAATTTAPDVILCDIDMFGMDGIEFTRHLATRKFSGGFATMSGSPQRLQRTVAALIEERHLRFLGALEKPFSGHALLTILQRMNAGPAAGAPPTESARGPLPIVTPEEVRAGIAAGYVRLFYQPKIHLDTNRVVGVEALLRWYDPVRGMIPPLSIVPVAEDHGIIEELTYAVFRVAAEQQAAWQHAGYDLVIAVNISADDLLRYDFPDQLRTIVQQTGANTSRITLEVTEGRLMTNMASGMEVISRLRLMGFNFSVDDFGTGYSNQEKLRRLPFDEIKIDRSFVSGAVESATLRAIVESNIGLAHALGMTVVAEGAEREADTALLRSLACDEVQGYFYCRPVPSDELIAWKIKWESVHLRD